MKKSILFIVLVFVLCFSVFGETKGYDPFKGDIPLTDIFKKKT